ncbi:family 78 glycoside hydrolase catalytic domain [Sphingobacterium hungaricum]
MMNSKKLFSFILLVAYFYASAPKAFAQSSSTKVTELFVDLIRYSDYQSANGYKENSRWLKDHFQQGQSVIIQNKKPTFSWIVESNETNSKQTAYQLLVSDDLEKLARNEGTIWDSGKVTSAKSSAVLFDGNEITSNKVYFWKVILWSDENTTSSRTASFYTGELTDRYTTAYYPLQRTDQHPVKITSFADHVSAIDFGKAAFGQLRLNLESKGQDTVYVRFGEKLDENGRIDTNPGGTIRYQEHKIALTSGQHTYQVRFDKDKRNTGAAAILMPDYIGEVLPFRYVELIRYSKKINPDDIVRSMVHYPFDDQASYFTSSDTTLNKIWDLSKYSIKATSFAGIYVDGDRERIPYEADALINQLCHYGVDLEFSMARRSHEYLINRATWPTEWIMQSVMMAWTDYLYTGDLRSIERYYEDLKAKSLTALEQENHLISTKVGQQSPEFLASIHLHNDHLRDIVDWPQKGILGLGKNEEGETDGFIFKEYNAVVNAYYYHVLLLMEKIANELGNNADAQFYQTKAKNVYESYQKNFFDADRKLYVDGIGTDHAALHSNMFALAFGLVPEKYKSDVLSFVLSRGMACSVYGSQFLMDALYDAEHNDYAFQLLTSQEERSWYNMIRVGSTISLEAWDNKYKPNQDWNHAWGAVPANIIPRKLMGIEPLTAGWNTFRIKPQLGSLTHASIKVPTIKGAVLMDFKQIGNVDAYQVTIPVNTEAELSLLASGKHVSVTVNGKRVKFKYKNKRAYLPNLPSGNYTIELSN